MTECFAKKEIEVEYDDLSHCQDLGYEEPKCLSWLLLAPRIIKATADTSVSILRKTFNTKDPSCCKIPETECPPRCVCTIEWMGMPGDTLHHEVKITNTGDKKRTFTLEPLPFACTDEVVKVTPNKKVLAPGESFFAKVSFKIPESMVGSHVQTEILFRGAYEQCIIVDLYVKTRDEFCCDIKQGEVPKRVRAHQWYNHFQCEELCFESLDPADSDRDLSASDSLTTRSLPKARRS